MGELIKPKQVTVKDLDGKDHTYTISRFPAVAGREIVAKYGLSSIPKLGDYAVNEEVMLKALTYVEVKPPKGEPLRLINRTLVENWVPDFECLMRLEAALLEYNTSFFASGRASGFFLVLSENLRRWITKTLTDSLEQLSQTTKRRSKS